MPPRFSRPGLVPGLTRAGDGVRRPARHAGPRVEGFHEPANAELPAGDAGEDHVLHHERRAGDAVALPPVDDWGFPPDGAGLTVERNHPGVHCADEHQIAPEGHATVDRAAAVHALHVVADLRVVGPFFLAGAGIDGEDPRLVGRQINHAVVNQGRGLEAAIIPAGREDPGRAEPADVARCDLLEADEALRVIVASVGEPRTVVRRRILEGCRRHQLGREAAVEGKAGERERHGLGGCLPCRALTDPLADAGTERVHPIADGNANQGPLRTQTLLLNGRSSNSGSPPMVPTYTSPRRLIQKQVRSR